MLSKNKKRLQKAEISNDYSITLTQYIQTVKPSFPIRIIRFAGGSFPPFAGGAPPVSCGCRCFSENRQSAGAAYPKRAGSGSCSSIQIALCFNSGNPSPGRYIPGSPIRFFHNGVGTRRLDETFSRCRLFETVYAFPYTVPPVCDDCLLFIQRNTPIQITTETMEPAGEASPIGNSVSRKCLDVKSEKWPPP